MKCGHFTTHYTLCGKKHVWVPIKIYAAKLWEVRILHVFKYCSVWHCQQLCLVMPLLQASKILKCRPLFCWTLCTVLEQSAIAVPDELVLTLLNQRTLMCLLELLTCGTRWYKFLLKIYPEVVASRTLKLQLTGNICYQ